jgi:RimJ/RimL family protein N-acetyltransferase
MHLPATVALKGGGTALLRRATPEDAEAQFANLNAIGAERIYLLIERSTRTVEELRAQLGPADPHRALWLVAERYGRVVGGADFHRGLWQKSAHTATLGIALLPEARGLGLGEALLRTGIDWAREVGVQKVKLSVFSTNDRALALYRKLGFEEEARLKREAILDGQPVDEVLMALWL